MAVQQYEVNIFMQVNCAMHYVKPVQAFKLGLMAGGFAIVLRYSASGSASGVLLEYGSKYKQAFVLTKVATRKCTETSIELRVGTVTPHVSSTHANTCVEECADTTKYISCKLARAVHVSFALEIFHHIVGSECIHYSHEFYGWVPLPDDANLER